MSAAIPAHAGRPLSELRASSGDVRLRSDGGEWWHADEHAERLFARTAEQAVRDALDGGQSPGPMRVFRFAPLAMSGPMLKSLVECATTAAADWLTENLGPSDDAWPAEAELEECLGSALRTHLEEHGRAWLCECVAHRDFTAMEVAALERELLGQRPEPKGTPLPEPVEVLRFEREGR